MSLLTMAERIESTALARAISQSTWLFPTIETIHVIAIALVVGSIAALDLRLLGVSWARRPVSELAAEVLPWTWTSFAVAVTAGSLLFISAAAKYVVDLPFQLKMGLILLAGANMIAFHLFTFPSVESWNLDVPTPPGAKLAAALSLAIWIAVVACGRLVSFTTQELPGAAVVRAQSPSLVDVGPPRAGCLCESWIASRMRPARISKSRAASRCGRVRSVDARVSAGIVVDGSALRRRV